MRAIINSQAKRKQIHLFNGVSMNLQIHKIIGPRCIVKDDGQRIYETIHEALLQDEKVTLDFDQVTQYASPFFNFAIGQLLKDIAVDNLKRLLKVENLTDDGKMVVHRVIENASRYYTDTDYSKIVDSILEQQSREAE